MTISMYQASIPVFIRGLENLSHILAKGAAHAEAKKVDPSVFITSRLYPDMFALARQVQIASDTAKGAAARLSGIENPSFADTESTFPELQERIAKTIVFLKSIKPEQIDGSEDRPVVLPTRSRGDIHFTAQNYLLQQALPNFYFHVTTAYAILRHNGVELGKWDFYGNFS
ncbi:MAG TPA: DUF1993 domain-containing protein [Rhodocyclaceae bacterium]|jgi:hypothetical protein|nr:DUF1993 domain-containing protein [Rhodocyclaceae bacterium]